MYNRYIPQPDGSYQKRRVPEPRRPEPPRRQPAPARPKSDVAPPPIPCQESCPPSKPSEHPPAPHCNRQPPCRQDSITGFFKQLLPKDLDTADLLIILLLLLMAGDCEEDRNNALLTLALYFFM